MPLSDAEGNRTSARWRRIRPTSGQSVNIEDVYQADVFNFSRHARVRRHASATTRKSFLTVPMNDHEGELVGVLQLINARDPETGRIVAFSPTDQRFIEALAAQAAVAITNQQLVLQLEELLESLVNLINIGIDEKSPYTGPPLPVRAGADHDAGRGGAPTRPGPLAGFRMTDADRKELWLAGLLHDCGKITTPVHVVDKATKLETIFDRIHMIDTRFEVLHARRARSRALQRTVPPAAMRPRVDARLAARTGAAARRPRLPARGQCRRRRHGAGRPGARARRSRATAGPTSTASSATSSTPTKC